jgi:hypothetical protein
MRLLLKLATGALADKFWFDGRYAASLRQEIEYQGKQFSYEMSLITRKLVGQ